jgi:hypothetical protein
MDLRLLLYFFFALLFTIVFAAIYIHNFEFLSMTKLLESLLIGFCVSSIYFLFTMDSEIKMPEMTVERQEAKKIYDECYAKLQVFGELKAMPDQEKRVFATLNAITVVENILRVLYYNYYDISNGTFEFYEKVKAELELKLNYNW